MSTTTVGRPRLDASGPLQHVNIRVPRRVYEWAREESERSSRPIGEVLRDLVVAGLGVIE